MEAYQLRSFVVLAEHLHFGRAALALHITQPALTKQIRKLEDEVGVELFERLGLKTQLSSVGERWLPEAKAALARLDVAERAIKQAAEGEIGSLRIGFGFHTLDLVMKLVSKLRGLHPKIELSLRDLSSAEQEAALTNNELDLGFLRLPLTKPGDWAVKPVVEDRLMLVVPSEMRARTIKLADLRDAKFVSISRVRSPGFSNHVLSLCAAHGFHPQIVQEVFEFSTAIGFVRAGMGLTFVPESMFVEHYEGVRFIKQTDPRATWKVAAVWRKRDMNPALKSVTSLLAKA